MMMNPLKALLIDRAAGAARMVTAMFLKGRFVQGTDGTAR
jgi:hypothetical protein